MSSNPTSQQVAAENYVQQIREMTEGLPTTINVQRS
jgi:hypothetical protein